MQGIIKITCMTVGMFIIENLYRYDRERERKSMIENIGMIEIGSYLEVERENIGMIEIMIS